MAELIKDTTVGGDYIYYQLNPVGAIIPYGGNTAPPGYLMCNGASVSRGSYAKLFDVIGTTYGGSGSSFNLPDLSGYFVRGQNMTSKGHDAARSLGSKQGDLYKTHTHTYKLNNASTTNETFGPTYGIANEYSIDTSTTGTTNSANETRPDNLAVCFCIKV